MAKDTQERRRINYTRYVVSEPPQRFPRGNTRLPQPQVVAPEPEPEQTPDYVPEFHAPAGAKWLGICAAMFVIFEVGRVVLFEQNCHLWGWCAYVGRGWDGWLSFAVATAVMIMCWVMTHIFPSDEA